MGILRSYRGVAPTLGDRVFVAETAAVIGDVVLGDDVSVWYSAVVRGDCHYIRVGARTNIQDGAVLHVTGGTHPCVVGEEVTIGHGAMVHGCTVGRGALIGIGAKVLDGAEVGDQSFVAAGALVSPGTKIPARTMWWGAPARFRRELSEDELEGLRASTRHYLEYKSEFLAPTAEVVR